jgi:MFS family permease
MGIASACLIAWGLFHPFCGVVLDKFRLRPLYFASLAIFTFALLLISLTTSYWAVLLSYALLLPVGMIICGPLGSQALVSPWFTIDRGLAFGVSGLGGALGGILIPSVVTALNADFGWRISFRVLALGTVVLLAPIAWLVLSRKPPLPAQPVSHRAGAKTWRTLDLLRLSDFWILTAVLTSFMMAFLPLQHSIGAVAQDFGIPPSNAAIAASSSAGALAAGGLIFGRLADWFPHKRLLHVLVVLGGASVAGVSMARGFPQYAACLSIASFATGGTQPLVPAIVTRRFGTKAFGQVYGLVAGPFVQIGLVATYFCGLIHEATGSYSVAYLLMLIPMPFVLTATLFLSETRPEKTTEMMG